MKVDSAVTSVIERPNWVKKEERAKSVIQNKSEDCEL